jgi:hypothetical protein
VNVDQKDFQEMLSEGRFSPFEITMNDGFSIAIGPKERPHVLVGARMLAMLDAEGGIVHLPYRSIAHIGEPKGNGAGP